MEKIQDGPSVLVANHNIGAAFEIAALLDAWERRFGGRVPIYGLAHRFPFRIPGFAWFLRKIGGVPATYEDAFRVLDSGASLAIFPGGNHEAARPFSARWRSDWAGHKGWARIALSRKVPVVPISIVGSHSVNPVLWRSRILSFVFVVPWALGIRVYPITLAQLVYPSLVFALAHRAEAHTLWACVLAYLTFLLAALWPIWPARIEAIVGEPLRPGDLGEGDTETQVDAVYREVTRRVQGGIDFLKAPCKHKPLAGQSSDNST